MKRDEETPSGQPTPEAEVTRPAPPYEPPSMVVHDADEFIRSLGPAQACSPSPSIRPPHR